MQSELSESSLTKLLVDLKNSLKPSLSKNPKFNDLFKNKQEANDLIKKQLLESWEMYASGNSLYDFAATLTDEQEDLYQEGNVIYKRNAIMFDNTLNYINNLDGPILITCGANHLLGRTGLLTRLSEAGASIELYNYPTNSFNPYIYPYKYYLMGLESIKQGIFFSSSKSNSVAIVPYNAQQPNYNPKFTMKI